MAVVVTALTERPFDKNDHELTPPNKWRDVTHEDATGFEEKAGVLYVTAAAQESADRRAEALDLLDKVRLICQPQTDEAKQVNRLLDDYGVARPQQPTPADGKAVIAVYARECWRSASVVAAREIRQDDPYNRPDDATEFLPAYDSRGVYLGHVYDCHLHASPSEELVAE